MQVITEYTRHSYRAINRALSAGDVTEQAAALIEAVSALPALPGTSYRTFWVDDLEGMVTTLKSGKVLYSAFTSTSRLRSVAERVNGNVKLTIEGYSGWDIAPYSDAPLEMETLFLPGRTFRVKRVRVKTIAGRLGSVEADLVEL
ncbi:hypothetical protein DYU11_25240 [Fibrisoma montanum]|uniref:NAD(+)--protein-arginine ADP-ribosyltransferase n=1 Tax=Fibrisoma montanum TaxID=2305895 RepID=A0A418M137_9BACT|nr:ADP-ribosyltransferase domain-containing protein [Fibrisoma montanum]RIV19409.1 hypothetical protein DYU11_25240 [Fibrisoma montanum]